METEFAIRFFGALFAIMNPFVGLPLFLAMTEEEGPAAQRRIALQVAGYIAMLGTATALLGAQALAFFGISIHDLQVAGGLVVLGIAFSMLKGSEDSMHHGSESEQSRYPAAASIAFYPLAFPLMMGPGTLTTMILFAGEAKSLAAWTAYGAAFAAVVVAVGVVFALGGRFGTYLSGSTRVIMTRLMGLILAAIAVQMIVGGLRVLLPGLMGPGA